MDRLYSSHSGFYENLPWFSPLRGRFARPNWVLPICQGCFQHDSSSSHINPYAPATHHVDAYLKFLTAVSIDPATLQKSFKIEKNLCFTSNDPDYLAEKLLKLCNEEKSSEEEKNSKKAFIIDLTPDLTVSDLLVSITAEKQQPKDEEKESSQEDLRFKIQKEAVFKALEAGETVILNGSY